VGKLHNDRYVPLLPMLVDLIVDYKTLRGASRSGRLLERDDGRPFDRRTVHRYVASVAKRAGIAPVHPHQLRHTLATQSINRGMSLEAIAALLGHRSMDMTLTYARISDRTVADQYFKVTEAVEAEYYGRSSAAVAPTAAPANENPRPDHRRLLANGHCTRPALLGCAFESVCERCGFFETGPQFVTILKRQRKQADQRCRRARLSRNRFGSKEVLVDEVCQAPTTNCLRCDHHPDLVDTLLPGQRHVAVDPAQQFVKVLEFDLFTGATNEDTPSRTADFIDVVDLEGNVVFPQSPYFGSIL